MHFFELIIGEISDSIVTNIREIKCWEVLLEDEINKEGSKKRANGRDRLMRG